MVSGRVTGRLQVFLWCAVGMLLLGAIGLLDHHTPKLSLSIFYLIPISVLSWRVGRGAGLLAALVATPVSYFALVAERDYDLFYRLWNGGSRLVIFAGAALLLANLREVLERERHRAAFDALTTLPNRRAFFEAAEAHLKAARRQGKPVALAYIDVDGFKGVNDVRGHAAGDELLKEVARSLREVTRTHDLCARLGGDEFVVLMADANAAAAERLVARIGAALTEGAKRGDWPVSFSIGMAAFDEVPLDIEELVHIADARMYEIKKKGAAERRSESRVDGVPPSRPTMG